MSQQIVVIAFRAVATNKFGHPYDASFLFHFPVGKVTADEVNSQIMIEMQRFHQLHPTGQILEQFQRVGYIK